MCSCKTMKKMVLLFLRQDSTWCKTRFWRNVRNFSIYLSIVSSIKTSGLERGVVPCQRVICKASGNTSASWQNASRIVNKKSTRLVQSKCTIRIITPFGDLHSHLSHKYTSKLTANKILHYIISDESKLIWEIRCISIVNKHI